MDNWRILAVVPADKPALLAPLADYDVQTVGIEDGFAAIRAAVYDIVLVYADYPDEAAFTLLKKVRKHEDEESVIFLSDTPSLANAVRAMRLGAYDYLRVTDAAENVRAAIERAAERGRLAREVLRLRNEVDKARGLHNMVGSSMPMKQLLSLAQRVATADATVLIIGESGTGKELLARTIHRLGPRADQPFVAFDCSALSATLLEAELFGHEKGSFTGAGRSRRGLFREAHTGTIFLDEIGDIGPEVQNKLLRVLQEREVKPVGGDKFAKIDVRVLAATNKDLKLLIRKGQFREDLYWRLAVVPIQVPPLRERREDLPDLVAHILAKRRGAAKSFAGGEARYPSKISPVALKRLQNYHWPGNIRELENVLSRAAILCDGDEIRGDDLDLAGLSPAAEGTISADASRGMSLSALVDDAVARVERAALTDALDRSGGSVSEAAQLLGISRASVYNKLRKYGIK